MEFEPAERAYLLDMRMLTTDAYGQEIFTGLTAEESGEYYGFTRLHGMDRLPGETWEQHDAKQDRYLVLNSKHELARRQVIMAEVEARNDRPKMN